MATGGLLLLDSQSLSKFSIDKKPLSSLNSLALYSLQNKLKRMFDPDAPGDTHSCGALFNVIFHCPTGIGFFFVAQFQGIANPDHRNFEYPIYVLNITFNIGLKKVGMGSDLFGRQHAGESSHHSSRNGTNYVV